MHGCTRRLSCSVRALQAWIERAGITSGSLCGIGEKTVCRIIQRAADRAGIDVERVSGHSLRAGFATAVLHRYSGAGQVCRDNVAGALL